ncbi:hypothetical protein PG1616B_1436 [Bifidobacterium pseudolongum subsp. globosum]|uniref:Uncharacterized protein n=1 Tax=Bifidobacterium pseudolongum subsp. globosum TaxID=1690 RepID=A0AB37WZ12_9BIFI|nr:hypothetical protein PG2002B_1489 [Bifidobacterium pseudolongum subsp. globosum]RYQ41234.1 hypothetical protein PG2000B_1536 [Bifidobacterium pseudolongum subsp. globosum]RYQ53145.1 hypothetical protein PG1616B_1436 [Bifidobacterium pseudolongum subsp. globosum]
MDIIQSTSRKSNYFHNAPTNGLFSHIKNELRS